jgi:hypothetical protein
MNDRADAKMIVDPEGRPRPQSSRLTATGTCRRRRIATQRILADATIGQMQVDMRARRRRRQVLPPGVTKPIGGYRVRHRTRFEHRHLHDNTCGQGELLPRPGGAFALEGRRSMVEWLDGIAAADRAAFFDSAIEPGTVVERQIDRQAQQFFEIFAGKI